MTDIKEDHVARLHFPASSAPPTLKITCNAPDGAECNPWVIKGGSRAGERTCDVIETWIATDWDCLATDSTDPQDIPFEFDVHFYGEGAGDDFEGWISLVPRPLESAARQMEESYQRGHEDGFWNGKTTDMSPAQAAAFMAPYRTNVVTQRAQGRALISLSAELSRHHEENGRCKRCDEAFPCQAYFCIDSAMKDISGTSVA